MPHGAAATAGTEAGRYRSPLRSAWGALLPAALLIGLAGCEEKTAQAGLKRHDQSMKRTLGTLQEIEAARPESMRYTLDTLRLQHEKDMVQARENIDRVNELIQQDITRWEKRQPEYQREIDHQLRGHPENIPRTAAEIAW